METMTLTDHSNTGSLTVKEWSLQSHIYVPAKKKNLSLKHEGKILNTNNF